MKKKKVQQFLAALMIATTVFSSMGVSVKAANNQTIENLGGIDETSVSVDSQFNVPIQNLSALTISIPANMDLNYDEDTGLYSAASQISVKGNLADNCVITISMNPYVEYTNANNAETKVVAKSTFSKLGDGIIFWLPDEITATKNDQLVGTSYDFETSVANASIIESGDYRATVDFDIKCNIVPSESNLTDAGYGLSDIKVNNIDTKSLYFSNATKVKNDLAENGGVLEIPTFVYANNQVYPISRLSSSSSTPSYSPLDPDRFPSLTSVVIPEGIHTYGDFLENCNNLTSITLPNSLKKLDSYAFGRDSALTHITIPEGVSYIGSFAFTSCTALESVDLPSELSGGYVFEGTFCYCSSLESVVLPKGVTSLDGTFAECTSLREITLPATVTSIYNTAVLRMGALNILLYPFGNCTSLETVNYAGTKNDFLAISGLNLLTGAQYNSGDLTIHCNNGDLHYTNGILDE